VWAREGGALGPVGTILEVLSVGRGGRSLKQPTKHVRTHTHKLKPLNHFTVVPQPLFPLRFNTGIRTGVARGNRRPTTEAAAARLPTAAETLAADPLVAVPVRAAAARVVAAPGVPGRRWWTPTRRRGGSGGVPSAGALVGTATTAGRPGATRVRGTVGAAPLNGAAPLAGTDPLGAPTEETAAARPRPPQGVWRTLPGAWHRTHPR